MTNNVYMHGIPKGKIIRDAVHGDIFVEDKFLKIIDTPEFQRMRRIKQLSVANIVFPSADHTRFSHSLGCFYVMKQIIAHFDSIFGKMGIEVSKQDKDIALLAALLHDIGHGPFSHAFEDIHPKGAAQVSHETWTSRIITCHSGTIYKQIEETFGKGTAEKVSELIEKQRRVKSSEENYIIEASNPVPPPLLGHRCRSSQEITGSPTPFSTSNHYLWICPRASFSLSNPNIAA